MYTTDALKLIVENTARYVGGAQLRSRYYDLINPKPEDPRTGEEIISHMKDKLKRIGGEKRESV